jgi:SPP1 gp7 family putative phage head morphogenesis protein
MSKAVPVARLCINTLKHKVTQTPWAIKPKKGEKQADEEHIKAVENLLNTPNRNRETFRTFLDKVVEDLLVLDAGCFEKVENKGGEPCELYYVDGSTIKPMYDVHGVLGEPAYVQFMPMNSANIPDAEWDYDEFVYMMQNPQADIQNFGYGLSPLEGVIMVATNALNADNYMGQFFDVGTLPPKLINLGKDVSANEVELFRAIWKSEIEGKPWKTAITGGSETMEVIDMGNGKPADMQFENYQTWLMKLMCAAYEISPQDIGMTAEMGLNRALGEVQQNISNNKGYRTILNVLKETINMQVVHEWFDFDDIEFDWVGLDTIDQLNAANIFNIESKCGATSINEYRISKGLEPIKGGISPFIITGTGQISIDSTPLSDIDETEVVAEEENVDAPVAEEGEQIDETKDITKPEEKNIHKEGVYGGRSTQLDDIRGLRSEIGYTTPRSMDESSESETETTSKSWVEKKVHTPDDYICWVDDRGFGQPFIFTDKFGKNGYVIKPPVAVNINAMEKEVQITHEMNNAGLNVLPVDIMTPTDIGEILPSTKVKQEFENYQLMTPEYDSKKWESKFGHSRVYDKYSVMKYIEGRILNDAIQLDDMKRVPDEYQKAILDLVALWKYEKEKGMGDRRANQYIITPDKRAYGFDYQFDGNEKAWAKYEFSIPKALAGIPKLYDAFMRESGLEVEDMKKFITKGGEGSGGAREGAGRPAGSGSKETSEVLTQINVGGKLVDITRENYNEHRNLLTRRMRQELDIKTEYVPPWKKSIEKETKIYTESDASRIGDELGVNWAQTDVNEFVTGLNEEQEHKDVIGDDENLLGKIVLAHLNEKPDYYTRLEEAMSKSKKKVDGKDILHNGCGCDECKKTTRIKTEKAIKNDEHWHDFWHKKVSVPETKMIAHLKTQSKQLKSNMARVIKDELVTRKAIVPDNVLTESANAVPDSDIALKYTKTMDKMYKSAFEIGIDNFLVKAEDQLKHKGITKEMLYEIVGKKKISKAIERSGLYDKLKERGTNLITTVVGNKQKKLVSYIQDRSDKGDPMDEISSDAMEKFALPLEDYEVECIARTETAWAANQGSLEAGSELGIDNFEIILDPDVCPGCQDAYEKSNGEGDVFTSEELSDIGEPPLHPNCRCIVEPYIDADNLDDLANNIIEQAGGDPE